MIIIPKIKSKCYSDKLETILETKTNKENMQFALNCANDVVHLANIPIAQSYLDLVQQYLNEPNSVNLQDLRNNCYNFSTYLSNKIYNMNAIHAVFAALVIDNKHRIAIYAARDASYAIINNYHKSFSTKLCNKYLKFYIHEIILQLIPHSTKSPPIFNLNIQEEFLIALDWITEYKHENLIQFRQNKYYFVFHDFLKENTLNELITAIFNNNTYKNQITRIISKLLRVN